MYIDILNMYSTLLKKQYRSFTVIKSGTLLFLLKELHEIQKYGYHCTEILLYF